MGRSGRRGPARRRRRARVGEIPARRRSGGDGHRCGAAGSEADVGGRRGERRAAADGARGWERGEAVPRGGRRRGDDVGTENGVPTDSLSSFSVFLGRHPIPALAIFSDRSPRSPWQVPARFCSRYRASPLPPAHLFWRLALPGRCAPIVAEPSPLLRSRRPASRASPTVQEPPPSRIPAVQEPPPSRIPAVLTMYRPPHPRSSADGGAGMWNPPPGTLPLPQYTQRRFNPEANRSIGELHHSGVGLISRRVVSPTSSHVRLADDLLENEQEDAEQACTGAMDSGYYMYLLVNDVEETQDIPAATDPTIDDAP